MKKRLISVITICALLISGCNVTKEISSLEKDYGTKVNELLKSLSVKEKVGQLMQVDINTFFADENDKTIVQAKVEKALNEYGIGSLLITPSDKTEEKMTNESWTKLLTQISGYSKAKIPVMYAVDAVHGFHLSYDAMAYPHNLGLGATFDAENVEKSAYYTAKHLRSVGIQWNYSPVLDVSRDPRWGRTYETFGEDPFISATLGSAMVRGYQTDNNVAACGKHFIGYSASNTGKDRSPADISEASLYDYHTLPYEEAIDNGLLTVMVNSSEVNSQPANASTWLLTDVLKKQLKLAGFAISDISDVKNLMTKHKIAANLEEAQEKAFNAGLDMNMVPDELESADALVKAIENKKVEMSRIDDAVKRVLMVKLKLGLFDDKKVTVTDEDKQAEKEVALSLARESMTLLKNEDVLPLSKNLKSILVVGSSAVSMSNLCGGWTYEWEGLTDENMYEGKTVLRAIQDKVGANTKVTFMDENYSVKEIVAASKKADATIAVVGETPYAEWTGDTETLALSEEQRLILDKLWLATDKLATVFVSGRPLVDMAWGGDFLPAMLWAYLPGGMGGQAIADTIFGDHNPTGKTPITIPDNVGQLPLNYNSRINTEYMVRFPFGSGVNYSELVYSNLVVPGSFTFSGDDNQELKVKVTITNNGKYDANEPVLLFMCDEYAPYTRPQRQLVAYTKQLIKAGESREIELSIKEKYLKIRNMESETKNREEIERIINLSCGNELDTLAKQMNLIAK